MTRDQHVLVVEDDALVRLASVQSLQLAAFDATGVGSAEEALAYLDTTRVGALVSDVRLPGASGLELLAHCRERRPDVPVILMTGHGDISMAVTAMRDGAYDFIEKPFASERLVETVRRALEHGQLIHENRALRSALAIERTPTSRIIGRSPAIEQIRRLIANVAPTDAPVLIHGDTGSGKELIARSLHEMSTRGEKPFLAVNCAALPETMFESEMFGYEAGAFTGASKRRIGKIEHASGGTLFLDEIESMPLALQAKLLRVLQEGTLERLGSNQPIRVDCRIVAAVKGDIEHLMASGQFRRDLFYRLNVVTVTLPPLSERREDIVPLFEAFVLDAAVRYARPARRIPPEFAHALMQRAWPGNIRELRNAADRFVLGIEDAPATFEIESATGKRDSLRERVDQFERAVIADTLARCGGVVAVAAEHLQVGKATLYEKLKRYGITGANDAPHTQGP
ncbi:sigma-54-dependent transcriptional regulator [Pararobbsia silviterrae]|uniref:Sigma-54-dependent Fis family transcriptional regulator n=1 Tax=Pararobbsia silviterrae TaxID=1792498 RepID=A0A494X9H6_9BURK|nr:sigma-54 dependent transcriptional regulator [Pararobbsia silviterrae]RKP45056.1 sigma-54-dependent Fis family transcriptional regulator [Pararobbsia silviterrae]